jgi:hypothetical protein
LWLELKAFILRESGSGQCNQSDTHNVDKFQAPIKALPTKMSAIRTDNLEKRKRKELTICHISHHINDKKRRRKYTWQSDLSDSEWRMFPAAIASRETFIPL